MKPFTVRPATGPLDATIRAAPSKSVTHRALVAAGLARGTTRLRGPLDAEDTRVTREGLKALGIPILVDGKDWYVDGCGGRPPGGGRLQLEQSGSSLRFLLAVGALGLRPSRLSGTGRLPQRPLEPLVQGLSQLGASIRLPSDGNNLPLEVGGTGLRGGSLTIDASASSQFPSALLMIASSLPGGLELTVRRLVSAPYLQLTVEMLRRFGARIDAEHRQFNVHPGQLTSPGELTIDGDHSSASYFLAAAAIVGGRVRVEGLSPASTQPDARLTAILESAGCRGRTGRDWVELHAGTRLRGFNADLREAPDLAPTLAVLALFADGQSELRGLAHLRHKESDRLEQLRENLSRFGADARIENEDLIVHPRREQPCGPVTVQTAGDHRMAMAFAIAGLSCPGITIDDPACVAKSHPQFWSQLEQLESNGS